MMKKSLLIQRLIGLGGILAAVGTLAQNSPNPDPICGYAIQYQKIEAERIQQGLVVQVLAGELQAGEISPLRFCVSLKPQDEPVDDLQVEHEKLMHVIAVRDDLQEFTHIHPQRVAAGLWQVNHAFTAGGRYQVWCDVKRQGVVYSFQQPLLEVAGKPPRAVIRPSSQVLEAQAAGFQVTLTPLTESRAGDTNRFQVTIRNSDGGQIGAEFFLGALMHIVVIKDDLSVYAHGHAENHLKGERDIYFNQVFPVPGRYKIFVQFRPLKTKLAPDEALLAEFWVKVKL